MPEQHHLVSGHQVDIAPLIKTLWALQPWQISIQLIVVFHPPKSLSQQFDSEYTMGDYVKGLAKVNVDNILVFSYALNQSSNHRRWWGWSAMICLRSLLVAFCHICSTWRKATENVSKDATFHLMDPSHGSCPCSAVLTPQRRYHSQPCSYMLTWGMYPCYLLLFPSLTGLRTLPGHLCHIPCSPYSLQSWYTQVHRSNIMVATWMNNRWSLRAGQASDVSLCNIYLYTHVNIQIQQV